MALPSLACPWASLTEPCRRGPNDDKAQDNLNLFHHVFALSLGSQLFLAPIRADPQHVLDLGTGTGTGI